MAAVLGLCGLLGAAGCATAHGGLAKGGKVDVGNGGGDPLELQAIALVVQGVVTAVNNKDGVALATYYRVSNDDVYFGLPSAPVVHGNTDHVNDVTSCAVSFQSINVQPNNDLRIEQFGPLAFATVTGINSYVDDGGPKTGPFRWTIAFQKMGPDWRIIHEHLSFYVPGQ